jgi:hypothetical protein
MEQLHHETSESLEGTRNAHSWADPDEYVLGSVDVDLKPARLVDRRVEEGEEALECHVSCILPRYVSLLRVHT